MNERSADAGTPADPAAISSAIIRYGRI
jgi:hypothetical protein